MTCPDCGHHPDDHGTFGCLYGWDVQHYGPGYIAGCRCNRRGVNPYRSADPNNQVSSATHSGSHHGPLTPPPATPR